LLGIPKNVGCADRCRKIAISLIGTQKGEGKAHACAIAFYEKVIKVKADVAAFLN